MPDDGVCMRNGNTVDTRVLRVCDGMDGVSWRAIGGVYSC